MNKLRILLVEDDLGDIRLTREALRENQLTYELSIVRDGEAAIAFLRNQGEFAHEPRPNIIVLDLNLPRKDGREVLQEIKADPELKQIPVIVLSTSDNDTDILTSYQLHANTYVTKPDDYYEYIEAVKTIEKFWLRLAKLPHKGDT